MTASHPPAFTDCAADFQGLGELMATSWRQNAEQPLEYSAEFLSSCFEYPGMRAGLAPALFQEGRPQAFVAGFPRTLSVEGIDRSYVLMTFFTVAPQLKGQGVGTAIWAECLRRAQASGLEGALHFCVDGNASNRITVAAARAAGFGAVRIFSVPYLMRFLGAVPAREPGPPAPDEALGFLQASARALASTTPVARQWSMIEADWQLRRRLGACSEWSADGGLLAGYILRVADAGRTPCLFVEDIHWAGLPLGARLEMLERFLARAATQARFAVVPLLGYADMAPFKAAGFRRSPRLLHAYLTPFHHTAPDSLTAFYADVL